MTALGPKDLFSSPNLAAQLAAAQVNNAGGTSAGTTINHNTDALSPADLMRVLEQSGQGAAAYGWIGQAHG